MTGSALMVMAVLLAGDTISPIVLPKPDVPLSFSHQQHLKLGLKCTMCHPGVLRSKSSADVLFPKEPVCLTCHNTKARNPAKVFPKATCDTCHPGFRKDESPIPPRIHAPRPNLKFPHRTHTIIGILCTDCHKGMDKAREPSWDHIPSMDRCLDCHTGSGEVGVNDQCGVCHPTQESGRLITDYPAGKLWPTGRFRDDDHTDPAWAFKHRVAALGDQAYCQNCHAESECLDCHAGATKPTFHSNNYSLLHAKDAYTDGGQCMSCHVASRDCQTCHEQTNLTLSNRAGGQGAVHPPGWASFAVGSDHHAPVARRSAAGCASCHAEQDCMECHSSRTLRISPHPAGFNPDRFRARTEAACKKCHDTIP